MFIDNLKTPRLMLCNRNKTIKKYTENTGPRILRK